MGIFVTGSSAHMLSKEISTTLRGRGWAQEVFPCSFTESLSFKGVEIPDQFTPKKASQMRHAAEEYLIFGGFPESLFLAKGLQLQLLQDYMHALAFKDVVDRYRLTNSHMVKKFLVYCLRQPASLLSVSKMFNTFKSIGESIGKNSLYEYLSYFEDAYALFAVPIFNFSETIRQSNPKKIYAGDPGLVSAYSVKPEFEKAARLETAVFNHLRRESKDIFYYRTIGKKEVDFLVMSVKGDYSLYQVSVSLSKESTRAREIEALTEAAQELSLKEGTIITIDEEETFYQNGVQISVQPFWKWALKMVFH
jgi:predicted AAA+ superfamily ATPase